MIENGGAKDVMEIKGAHQMAMFSMQTKGTLPPSTQDLHVINNTAMTWYKEGLLHTIKCVNCTFGIATY